MQNEDKAWIDYREKFSEVYDAANYSRSLQSSVMRESHRLAEKAIGEQAYFGRVLEVGAGTGEHLKFVRHTFGEYILSDLDPRTLDIAKHKLAHISNGNVTFDVQSGSELAYPDNTFDRVVAIHVLEHIYQPHLALKEWRRVLKHGGLMSIVIPTDPGIAWRLGRLFGPRDNAIARGMDYDYVMAREHVNSCNNLIAFLRHYFPGSKEAWWPLRIPSMDVNLFFAFHAIVDKRENGK